MTELLIEVQGDLILKPIQGTSHNLRKGLEYREFIHAVRERDNEQCQCCGGSEKQLTVHHIFPLAQYPDLRNDPDNGILLCQSCHDTYETKYRDNINPYTLLKHIKEHK